MLILSRRPNESLTIGDDVTVEVLEIRGNQVRLGITAPRSTVIERDDMKSGPKAGRGETGLFRGHPGVRVYP